VAQPDRSRKRISFISAFGEKGGVAHHAATVSKHTPQTAHGAGAV
jgi:hypothetical protein